MASEEHHGEDSRTGAKNMMEGRLRDYFERKAVTNSVTRNSEVIHLKTRTHSLGLAIDSSLASLERAGPAE